MKKIILLSILLIYTLLIVNAQSSRNGIQLPTDENIIYDLSFTCNGGALGVADGKSIKLFSTQTKELLSEFSGGHSGTILSLDISEDSTLLVSGGTDSTIVVWDLLTGRVKNRLKYHSGVVISLKISSNSRYLLSGGADGLVNMYELSTGSLLTSFAGHHKDVCSVSFHPDGIRYVSGGGDGLINVYNINNPQPVNVLSEHEGWIRNVIFNEVGDRMISCGDEVEMTLWNISGPESYKPLGKSIPKIGWVLSSDYHMDNETFVLGSLKGIVLISGKFGIFKTKMKKPVHCVRFNPGSQQYIELAVATRGSGVHIINSRKMKLER